MRNRINTLFFSLLLILTNQLFAGGFQINEHGARAMAMAGAFTAVASDPSAIYFNPAGITSLKGFQIMVGTTIIAPSSEFRGISPSVETTKMQSQTFTPSHAYLTYQISNDLYAGIGFNNPFGLGTLWDDKWIGRYTSIKTDLKTYSVAPTVAYKITDNLSVGASLLVNFATVEIIKNQSLAPFIGDAQVALKGSDNGKMGYVIAAKWSPLNNFSLGATYRSKVEYNFTGTATTTGPSQLSSKFPSGDITAKLVAPDQIAGGLAWNVNRNLMFSFDYQYIFWSTYDSLNVNFTTSTVRTARSYENTFIARLGVEYLYSPSLALRAGLLYDRNPVKDELLDAQLPDANRLGFTGGVGYSFTPNMVMDISYFFLRFAERTITNSSINASGGAGLLPFNGTYNSYAHLFSLSLKYSL